MLDLTELTVVHAWLELASGYTIQARASQFYAPSKREAKLIFPPNCPDHFVIEALSSDSNFELSDGRIYYCSLLVAGDRVTVEETHLRQIVTVLPIDHGVEQMAMSAPDPALSPKVMAYRRQGKAESVQSVSVVPTTATLPDINAIQIGGTDPQGKILVKKSRDLTDQTVKVIGVPCHLKDAIQLGKGRSPRLILHLIDHDFHRQLEFEINEQPMTLDGKKFALRTGHGYLVIGTVQSEIACDRL